MIRSTALRSALLIAFVLAGCGTREETSPRPASPEADTTMAAPDTTVADTLAAAATDSVITPQDSDNEAKKTMSGKGNYYEIETPKGSMVIRLYDETPKHRDNFAKLVTEKYYDGTLFHRVIEEFMIQGGDELSKDEDPLNDGTGGPGYTIDAEIQPLLFHKKGALAAARQPDQVNPERKSSGSQFYIVHGTAMTADELAELERQMKLREPNFTLTSESSAAYMTVGGTPFLDGQYTVFGELVEGFDVLDAIAAVETPRKTGERTHQALFDRPPEPIAMTVRLLPDYAAQ